MPLVSYLVGVLRIGSISLIRIDIWIFHEFSSMGLNRVYLLISDKLLISLIVLVRLLDRRLELRLALICEILKLALWPILVAITTLPKTIIFLLVLIRIKVKPRIVGLWISVISVLTLRVIIWSLLSHVRISDEVVHAGI